MHLPFATLIGAFALVAFATSQATLRAEEKCPSAEACLSKSLDRDWEQYYSVIERTAAERKKVAVLLSRAEALNKSADVAVLKAEQARIEERWRFAQAVGRALTEPRFKNFLASEKTEAVRLHAAARERARKETDLYRRLVKSTIGPERASVTSDIASYERESHELSKAFYRDAFVVSLNTVAKAGEIGAEHWTKLAEKVAKEKLPEAAAVAATAAYVEAMQTMATTGSVVGEAVHSGLSFDEAVKHHHRFEAFLEATKGTGQFALHVAELCAKSPDQIMRNPAMRESFGPLAARAGIWLNVVSLGLDTLLTVEAVDRLKAAEARQVQVETNDAHWRDRVDTAARAAGGTAARETRVARQIEHQQRLEALLKKIESEGG